MPTFKSNKSITLAEGFSLLAGALLAVAFAPFFLFPLALVSTATILALWLNISAGRAFFRGWLFGIGLFGTGVYWIFISIHTYGNTSIGIAFILTFLFVAILALFPALQGYWLNRFFKDTTDAKLLYAFPALWVLLEWIRSFLFSGFPWLTLGDSQINSPLKGYAPLLSVYGVSLMTAISGALLVSVWQKWQAKNKKGAYLNLVSLLFIWVIGAILNTMTWTHPIGKPIQVSLVQGNIGQSLKWSPSQLKPTLEQYRQLSQSHWDSHLVIWPESAIPIPLEYAQNFVNYMDYEARIHHSALLTGIAVTDKPGTYFNAVIAVGDHTNDFYLKRRLVPFGEYVPIPRFFGNLMQKLDIPLPNLVPGRGMNKPIEANGLKIATFICYEIAFAEQVAFPDPQVNLLLAVNDDAWFGHSIAAAQHLEMAQMRALETERPVLFVSNTGITAIITPKGKIQAKAPSYQPFVLTGNIQAVTGLTPWQRRGLDPVLILIIIFLTRSVLAQKKLVRYNKLWTRNIIHKK